MDVYAARTLCVYKLVFNRRRKKDEILDIHDLDGKTVIEHFDQFVRTSRTQLAGDQNTGKVFRLDDPKVIDTETILATVMSGMAGEDRMVVDTNSAKEIIEITHNQAPLVTTRVFLTCKNTGIGYALLCVEHAISGAGDTVSIKAFRQYLSDEAPNVVMKSEAVIEEEAIQAFRDIERIEIKYYLESRDIANSLIKEGDSVSLVYTHKRNRPFDMSLLSKIKSLSDRRTSLVGFKDTLLDSDKTQVSVRMKSYDGRVKTFIITDSFGMKIMEALNVRGDRPLSDADFTEICSQKCKDISSRIGRIV